MNIVKLVLLGLMNIIKTLVIFSIILGAIAWNAWVGQYIWNTLAVPSGMPKLTLMIWIAICIIYEVVLSSSYLPLLQENTSEYKEKYHRYLLLNLLFKPILGIMATWVFRILFM